MSIDEEVLYRCYKRILKLEGIRKTSKKKRDDEAVAKELNSSIPYYCAQLANNDELTESKRHGYLIASKQSMILYARIRRKNNDLISAEFDDAIDKLVRIVCSVEALYLESLRMKNKQVALIDVENLLNTNNGYTKLASMTITDFVDSTADSSLASEGVYITKTGKCYHVKECPCCKGKDVRLVQVIDAACRLHPCKCVLKMLRDDTSHVTVFIDESVKFDFGGGKREGGFGNYSYIICQGQLEDESWIRDDVVLAKGVGFCEENKCVTKVAEEAISKVLFTLAYDLGFAGKVRIFTDNLGVVGSWAKSERNNRLKELFEGVTITYIPREHNTQADELLREGIIIRVSPEAYRRIKNKDKKIKVLRKKLKELETERAKVTNIVKKAGSSNVV